MGKVDALSCHEDHAVGVADDNKGVTVISPNQVRSIPIVDDIQKRIFDALVTWTETEVYHLSKRKESARNTMASSTIPLVRCTSPTTILCACTSYPPIKTHLLPGIQATRKPKNSLYDNITGPGWPRTSKPTLLDATAAHASKEATQSPPALLSHFSQAQCLGWTSAWTSSQTYPSPMVSILS